MLIYDEATGQYYDSEKVEAIIAYFLSRYAPEDWRERLNADHSGTSELSE